MATENQQAIINDVIEVKIGVYLYKIKTNIVKNNKGRAKYKMKYKMIKNFEERQLQELFQSVGWISANYSSRLVKALSHSDTVISAWSGSELVGLINAIDDGELTAYAHYLLIRPEYQNMGIGSMLVTKLKKRYEGYLYLILTAENEKLLPFYQKMGFRVVEGAVPMVLQTL